MILRAKDGVRGKLWDLDTGKQIPKIRWFDDVAGTFEAYVVDGNGEIIYENKVPRVYIGRGRLKFVPNTPIALQPAPAQSPAKRKPKKRQRYERIDNGGLLFGGDCEAYGCNRKAAWMVSDEVPLPPLVVGRRRFGRAKVVDTRFYCSWHYKPPRILDAKGEVIQEIDEIGVRPQ